MEVSFFFPSYSSFHPVPLSSIALGHVGAVINSGNCPARATSENAAVHLPVP